MEFRELVQATDAVRHAIEEGQWKEAAELEARRRDMLQKYIEQQSNTARLTRRLAELNDLTRNAIGETLHHQRKLEREVFTLQKGKKAIDAYDAVVNPNP